MCHVDACATVLASSRVVRLTGCGHISSPCIRELIAHSILRASFQQTPLWNESEGRSVIDALRKTDALGPSIFPPRGWGHFFADDIGIGLSWHG